jgi:hypothetical protein
MAEIPACPALAVGMKMRAWLGVGVEACGAVALIILAHHHGLAAPGAFDRDVRIIAHPVRIAALSPRNASLPERVAHCHTAAVQDRAYSPERHPRSVQLGGFSYSSESAYHTGGGWICPTLTTAPAQRHLAQNNSRPPATRIIFGIKGTLPRLCLPNTSVHMLGADAPRARWHRAEHRSRGHPGRRPRQHRLPVVDWQRGRRNSPLGDRDRT